MAHIHAVRIAAAHDGVAELVVTLRYGNGATADVTLDSVASAALMQSCRADKVEELTGQPWREVRDALAVSYNRYQSS